MSGHRQPRLQSRIPVEAHPGAADAASLEVTKNISTGGLCFGTRQDLEPGKVYELTIHLPAEDHEEAGPIACLVRVAWREAGDPSGTHIVGVEFVRISLPDQRKIYRYLDSF